MMASIGCAKMFQFAVLAVFLAGGWIMTHPPHEGQFSQADYLYLPPLPAEERFDIENAIPISKFATYPAAVRVLMQRAEFEQGRCRIGPGHDGPMGGVAMWGCNIWRRALAILSAHGWCWGGSDIVAEQHWLPCKEVPYAADGAWVEYEDYFSAADIREAQKWH